MTTNQALEKFVHTTPKSLPGRENLKRLLKFAKRNKKNLTRFESRLNGWLSNWGFKHEKQAVISPYIVDFLLPEYKVILELDGKQHEDNVAYDIRRDTYLTSLGYAVIRFKNIEMRDRQAFKTKLFGLLGISL